MHPRLVAVTGPLEGRVLELDREPYSIGRQRASALQLRDLTVSRDHCHIRLRDEEGGGAYLLEDLDSRHGTFVNGVPVRRRELRHGDVLQIGDSLLLFLVREVEDPGDPGPGPLPTADESSVRWDDTDFVAERTVERCPTAASRSPDEILAALSPGVASARRLQALLGLTNAIHEVRGVAPLAGRLAELLPTVLPAQRAAVVLRDPTGEPTRIHGWQIPEEKDSWLLSRTLVRRVLADATTLLAEDVLQEEALQGAESLLSQRIASVACAPLIGSDRVLGALYADTRDPEARFSEDDLDLLQAAAALASVALERALYVEGLEGENRQLREGDLQHDLVGESPAIEKLLDLVARAAATDSTVLLTGESGTGKELAARALHANSPRARGPFVAVNCATLSEPLLASELFGHEKGAFTGAIATKPGKLERAQGGTVFLDEVGEIPPALQAQLLRVLEEREIERVGGTRTIAVDVRVVAATNKDLEAAIREGTFRRDLYYRLDVVAVTLPPLRERREDIPLLARHFARRVARKVHRTVTGFAPEALAALRAYDWPGNVRELANAVERAVVLGQESLIRLEDLPETLLETGAVAAPTGSEEPPSTYHGLLHATKKRVILEALEVCDGVVTKAAERLDLHPNYLHRLISKLGLRDEETGKGAEE